MSFLLLPITVQSLDAAVREAALETLACALERCYPQAQPHLASMVAALVPCTVANEVIRIRTYVHVATEFIVLLRECACKQLFS